MEHELHRPPTRLLGEQPRTYPDKSEIRVAQHPWNCKVCDKPEPAGTTHAWMWNPNRSATQRDFMVHVEHWRDTEWEFFNEKKIDLQQFDQIIDADQTKEFSWAMEQLKAGKRIRRRNWKQGKFVKFDIRWDHGIAYVTTANSKHIYGYPAVDTDSDDWDLYVEP
jgi:hypothetical protein